MQRLSRLIYNKPFVYSVFFGLSFLIVLKEILVQQGFNNYIIFKYNFFHTVQRQNLFAAYPNQYYDLNHYGPVFSLIIAPFTFLPDSAGILLWVMFNAFILFKAIQLLPLKDNRYLPVLLICAHELMTSSASVQTNPMVAGLIILSYNFIKRERDFWAALMIVLGTFIKLYGIVGLAFFFFSDNKLKFVAAMVFWSVVLFLLPMAISSPGFIIQTYHDWYVDLMNKNLANENSAMQDICAMGLFRKIFNYPALSNTIVILPALALFALSYIRFNAFTVTAYQLLILSSALIFAVIYSSGSESPTYIIAFAGVAIWYMNLERPVTRLEIALLILALVVTSFSPSDLFPKYIRITYIKPYKLKALPCLLIWLKIIFETLTRRFPLPATLSAVNKAEAAV